MLAIALIGFAFAAISYKNGQARPATNTAQNEQHSEGEIEDDEI